MTSSAPHLRAAEAVWDYCEQSAAYVFGGTVGDKVADKLLKALRDHPDHRLTGTEQHKLFNGKLDAVRREAACKRLERLGLAVVEQHRDGTRGRPTTVVRLVENDDD